MGGVLSVIVFGLGAGLGIKAVEVASRRFPPLLRGAVVAGLAATNAVRLAASEAGRSMEELVLHALALFLL